MRKVLLEELKPGVLVKGLLPGNPFMMAKDTGVVMEEVVKHLTGIYSPQVHVTLEIEATIPDGVTENIVRTILENCATLKFKNQVFEEE